MVPTRPDARERSLWFSFTLKLPFTPKRTQPCSEDARGQHASMPQLLRANSVILSEMKAGIEALSD